MAKSKLGRVLSRIYKREFGKNKIALPKKCNFLSDVLFYAVTECQLPDSDKRQTRVEILPNSLKKLLESHGITKNELAQSHEKQDELFQKNKELRKQKKEQKRKLDCAIDEILELETLVEKLEFNNEMLMNNMNDDFSEPQSEYKSHLQLANERGMKVHGKTVQAGLPGSGKKR